MRTIVDIVTNETTPANQTKRRKCVAAIVVCHNGESCLDRCMESLRLTRCRDFDVRVIAVDNNSSDGTRELLSKKYRQVHSIFLQHNLGYGAGANVGWQYVQTSIQDADYVCILNQDLLFDVEWLAAMLDAMSANPEAGIAQPQLLLKHEPKLINAVGLRCHYLGFSTVDSYGSPEIESTVLPFDVDAVSGAALMIRRSLFKDNHRVFSEDLMMYLEDVELSWVARCRGFECLVVPAARVYHEFHPESFLNNYYLLERNRWVLILTHYPLRLLVPISPALFAMEILQCVWAAAKGLLVIRLRVYRSLLSPSSLRWIVGRRRRAENEIGRLDRRLIGRFTGRVTTKQLGNGLLLRLANTIFSIYWQLVRYPVLCLLPKTK